MCPATAVRFVKNLNLAMIEVCSCQDWRSDSECLGEMEALSAMQIAVACEDLTGLGRTCKAWVDSVTESEPSSFSAP